MYKEKLSSGKKLLFALLGDDCRAPFTKVKVWGMNFSCYFAHLLPPKLPKKQKKEEQSAKEI